MGVIVKRMPFSRGSLVARGKLNDCPTWETSLAMRYRVVLEVDTSETSQAEQALAVLEHPLLEVMDALVEQEESHPRMSDSDLSICLGEHRAALSVDVIAQSYDDAADVGKAAMRAAIHAAGGFTPGWDVSRWRVESDAYQDEDGLIQA